MAGASAPVARAVRQFPLIFVIAMLLSMPLDNENDSH
jgi:hypothetical protein